MRDRCTLTVLAGPFPGTIYTLEGEVLIFGRDPVASIRVDDPSLSRRHARVFRNEQGYFVEDLDSRNGTFVDGKKVEGLRQLQNGDRIQMGRQYLLRFDLHDARELEAVKQMYEAAVRDPLTQVYNRRYLWDRLRADFAFAQRHHEPLSVLMADLDRFKSINDRYGHLAGDAVLRVVAKAMQRTVRAEDLVARYGGEEMCIVARGTDQESALILGERIRKMVEEVEIAWEGSRIEVTTSVGLATFSQQRNYPEVAALVAAADEALFRAKKEGRNRCLAAL